MTLFLDNGHLTDEGLRALVEGSLDEMERLEAAEHLSFCDECLVRYTELLTEPVCQDPPQDLTLPVMRSLRQRTFRTACCCPCVCGEAACSPLPSGKATGRSTSPSS